MSFNIEVLGGKNYLLPTGGKYCPQDIAIAAIGGATEGMYCWQKSHKVIEYPNLTTTGITLTPSGNGFTITSSSGNAWASHLIHSPVLSTEGKDINVIHTISGTAYPYFIGFSSNAETVHTAFDHCVYIVNGGTIQHIASNAVVGEYGSYAVGDVIRINLKDGKFTAYKNESFLFSVDYALESVVMNATFHYGSVNYGTIECSVVEETDKSYVLSDNLNAYPQDGYGEDGFYYKRLEDNIPWHEAGSYVWSKSDASGTLVEYVVSDNENEFPADGQAADGYYYKLQEMGVSLKYANGSGSVAVSGGMVGGYSCTIAVSNLNFAPKAVYLSWTPNQGSNNESEMIDFNGTTRTVHDLNGGTFTLTENGFSFYTNSGLYPSSAVSYSWYALGM